MDRPLTGKWLERAALALLLRREMYGFEMADAVRAAAERETGRSDPDAFAEGSIYPVLRRLEHGGLLAGRWVEAGPEMPRRRYYSLTPNGRRAAASDRRGTARTVSSILPLDRSAARP